jgi:hypothetical protein
MDERWVQFAAGQALDKYAEYMEYDGNELGQTAEDLRWAFIDQAVEIFQAITGRNVSDEIVY